MKPSLLVLATFLALLVPLVSSAQTQRVIEDRRGGLQPAPRPAVWLPSAEIHATLGTTIETRTLQDPMSLIEFLLKVKALLPKKAKDLEFYIDQEAFRNESPDAPDPLQTLVKLPPYPKKMSIGTTLRLALSKVPTNNATYWMRSGQFVITTHDKARGSSFLDEPVRGGNFKNKPLVEALDELAEWTGVSIIVDSRVRKRAQKPVTARVAGLKLETALLLMTDMADLRHVVVEDVIYVTSVENAKEVAAARQPKKTRQEDFRATLDNVPLAHFLEECMRFGMPVIVDARVKEKTKTRVTAKFINPIDSETAWFLLTDMAGVEAQQVDDAIYVTSPDNAAKVRDKLRLKRAGEKPAPVPPAPAPRASANSKDIDADREYVAEFKDLRLLQAMPARGYIADDKAWAKYWKALGKDKAPPVDFAKELVVIGVAGCPIRSVDAWFYLSEKGDLRWQFERSTISGQGFVVLMSVLPHQGVKTIQGEAIDNDE